MKGGRVLIGGFFTCLLVLFSCGSNDKVAKGDKPTREELKGRIKVMEDSIKGLQSNLATIKQIPNLTHYELINRLLDYYHFYPEDDYAAECLDKIHMKYTGLNIPSKAAEYADTLLQKYPRYPNRALVLESQGSTFDAFLQPRDTSKVRYYYELLLRENPSMNKQKRKEIKERLNHLSLSFDQYIEFKMNSIPQQ
jgi:hypothetical protein